MTILSEDSKNRLRRLMSKESYVPPQQGAPEGGAPMPPMPPGPPMGGGAPPPMPMPPDPSMGGGAPMPPPGPPMPMDPGAMPQDPTMGGMDETSIPVLLDMNDLKAILEEAASGGSRVQKMEKVVTSIAKRLGVPIEEDTEGEDGGESNGLPAYLQIPEGNPMQEGLTDEAAEIVGQPQGPPQGQPQGPSPQDQQSLAGVVNMLQGA